LGYISYLKKKWNRDVGYSSHDNDWEVCLLAMQMGATVIERHITLDRSANGLDHSSSSTYEHFKKLVSFASAIPILLTGNSQRTINQGELLNRQNLGRSYYAERTFKKGEILNLDELVYRSPNTGLNKSSIEKYIEKPLQNDLSKGEVLSKYHYNKIRIISDNIIEKANIMKLSLPVRLHDYKKIKELFPIGAFEFHLSFDELLSDINYTNINSNNEYSIHLPDYINPTQLMDPFSKDDNQRNKSIILLNRAAEFAKKLQNISNNKVPIVGSFSVVNNNRLGFFEQHNELFNNYSKQDVSIMPQWLPPIAWYFGGSVKLNIMNSKLDAEFLHRYNLDLCMDVCHLILGRNYYNFSTDALLDDIEKQIKHIHIADAVGIDGEGVTIDENNIENTAIIKKLLDYDCLKVIEVWQGHLDNGAGFKNEIVKLTKIYEER
jgi:N-acetylneuraminate synthase